MKWGKITENAQKLVHNNVVKTSHQRAVYFAQIAHSSTIKLQGHYGGAAPLRYGTERNSSSVCDNGRFIFPKE